MHYSDEFIEEIKRQNDIVDVISAYVQLRKEGNNYFGICPFHDEKTGSFSVSPSKQMFYCFGCHEGGNVISFVRKYERLTFAESIEFLATRSGLALPDTNDHETSEKEMIKEGICNANADASKYYQEMLRGKEGVNALEYLRNRGISDDTIDQFELGYASKNSNCKLYAFLREKGYSDSLLYFSGLFNYNDSIKPKDKYRNRVIFPIMDTWHKTVGFGGRVMDEGQPKYLNSAKSPAFDKSKILYGLNIAKTSKEKNIIVCEGYMDLISLHQAGFDQTVATLGTAFTYGHANLLKRYAKIDGNRSDFIRYKEILLCFDSDSAGNDAAIRANLMLHEVGLRAKVIDLRPYKDPDEIIKEAGKEEFQERIEKAENGFSYEIRKLEEGYDMEDPSGKSCFITDVATRLLRFDNPVERDIYVELVSKKYSVSEESVNKVLKRIEEVQ